MPTNYVAITGATHGIGRAAAEHFAGRGWNVAIGARNQDELADLAADWSARFPASELVTIAADLGTPAGWAAFNEQLLTRWPRLNLLLNNLGVFAPGSLLSGPADQLSQFLHTNLLCAHALTRGVLPLLRQAGRAHIITIGSVAVYDQPTHMPAYSISKAALHAWHHYLRAELADTHIRASLLVPGATYTRSWEGVDVNPSHLLQPEQLAATIGRLWDDNQAQDTDQLIIRPITKTTD
ncbi:MAG: SDR family oxidoreductase [Lewinella sp.]|nr:SDR family oxidoreductase [Lewinella sp.]